jgi:hypothetical protein
MTDHPVGPEMLYTRRSASSSQVVDQHDQPVALMLIYRMLP